jgi:hypothetical protein
MWQSACDVLKLEGNFLSKTHSGFNTAAFSTCCSIIRMMTELLANINHVHRPKEFSERTKRLDIWVNKSKAEPTNDPEKWVIRAKNLPPSMTKLRAVLANVEDEDETIPISNPEIRLTDPFGLDWYRKSDGIWATADQRTRHIEIYRHLCNISHAGYFAVSPTWVTVNPIFWAIEYLYHGTRIIVDSYGLCVQIDDRMKAMWQNCELLNERVGKDVKGKN